LLQENERAVKQGTSMPDVNFGQFDASIITGKAINELQGAGTGSLVEMVQGFGIGLNLVNWNEKALTIYQRMFKDDRVYLAGKRPESMMDINPRQFPISFKGSEIVGSPRNEVVFSPYIGMHDKLVMSLQGIGAGLYSKKYGREQTGVVDNDAMSEEIFAEAIDDAVLAGIVQAMTEPTPENATAAIDKGAAYLDPQAAIAAAVGTSPPPHPGLAVGPGAGAAPGPPGAAGGGGGLPVANFPGATGSFATPALNLPPGSPAPAQVGAPPPTGAAAGAPALPASGGGVTVQQALDTLGQAQLAGKAWLVGEIVAAGTTSDAVEIAVTNPDDKPVLQQAATFPVVFHQAPASGPQEDSIEIVSGGPQ
jgi:hypothetical protein